MTANTLMSTATVDAAPTPRTAIQKLLSDEASVIVQWVILAVTCQAINIFGTATNIINIICFVKQGFKDPVNVSFLGLAISDLGCLTTLIWINLCYTPAFLAADLNFNPIEFSYATIGTLHVSFTRVTCLITAFITLERCLCITAPLKVKFIFTPGTTSAIIVSIFIILITSSAPQYAISKLGLKFNAVRNKSILGLLPNSEREGVERITFIINNMCVPCLAFIVIIVCTSTLVAKLYNKNKWRMQSAVSSQADIVSAKNQNVAKMVIIICIMFIACFVPVSVVYLFMSMDPSFAVDGENRNILILVGGLGLVMESINSSMNIFVYYNMSSKFREVFHRLRSVKSSIDRNGSVFKVP